MIDALISSALLLAIPLVLPAMGGVLHRRSGVVNLGLEGQMLIGAFVGAVVSGAAGSWVVGVAAAALAGGVAGLLMSLVISRLHGNEIIVGLGFTIAIGGLAAYVLRGAYGVSGTLRVEGLDPLPKLVIPGIDGVPVLGALISGKDPLFWFCVVLVPVVALVLNRTVWGLRLRATGAAEDAASSTGLATRRIQDTAGALAGALSGIAGAHLVLGQAGLFNGYMVAGRGFIALAAFYFGRSRPWPTAAACVIFAAFDAGQIRLQTEGVSAQLVQTLPYVAVIVALTVTGIRDSRHRARTNAGTAT